MSAPQPCILPSARSRINRFVLHKPKAIAEACALLERHGDDAQVHAGGLNVVSAMKEGHGVGHLVHIAGLDDLCGIGVTDNGLRIGAAVTHQDIATSLLIRSMMPALADYVEGIGNIRIRVQGTIGGNVLANQPLYEVLPLLYVTGAKLEFVDADGIRTMLAPEAVMRERPKRALMTAIVIPITPVQLAWSRELRPSMSVVVARSTSEGDRVAVVGAPSGFAGFHVPCEGAASIAIDRGLETIAFSPSHDDAVYIRRAARVLVQRCLAKAADTP